MKSSDTKLANVREVRVEFGNDDKDKYDSRVELDSEDKVDDNKVNGNEIGGNEIIEGKNYQKVFMSKIISKSKKIVGFSDFFIFNI